MNFIFFLSLSKENQTNPNKQETIKTKQTKSKQIKQKSLQKHQVYSLLDNDHLA